MQIQLLHNSIAVKRFLADRRQDPEVEGMQRQKRLRSPYGHRSSMVVCLDGTAAYDSATEMGSPEYSAHYAIVSILTLLTSDTSPGDHPPAFADRKVGADDSPQLLPAITDLACHRSLSRFTQRPLSTSGNQHENPFG